MCNVYGREIDVVLGRAGGVDESGCRCEAVLRGWHFCLGGLQPFWGSGAPQIHNEIIYKWRWLWLIATLPKSDQSFWEDILWGGRQTSCYIWQKPNISTHKNNIKPSGKHRGGSVVLWGCFVASGPGWLSIDENAWILFLTRHFWGSKSNQGSQT